jgi:thiamine biosynthesis lipoprotein
MNSFFQKLLSKNYMSKDPLSNKPLVNNRLTQELTITKQSGGYSVSFNAMASPCEVIVQSEDSALAKQLGQLISTEVLRIEDKYSRYLNNSVCSAINQSNGRPVNIDAETYLLLNFAAQ